MQKCLVNKVPVSEQVSFNKDFKNLDRISSWSTLLKPESSLQNNILIFVQAA